LNQDAMGLVYRKDLFENPEEKENFKKKYGYELKAPETYGQLKDIAQFFTRPDEKFYGIALFGSSDYDAVTSAFNNVLWSYGGELWDPEKNKTEGVINSEASVSALEYFKSLFEFAPPGASGWYYDEVNNAVNQGQVAMGINWYYFFNSYLDPENNKNAQSMAFATLPGEKNSDGKFRQYNSVGGQGIGISNRSKNAEEAWKFLEWLMSTPIQWEWVKGGGQTGRTDILKSPQYTESTPYNADFPISMSRVKDYWHLVEYPKLLDIYQKYVHLTVTGEMSSKEALNKTAIEQQRILDKTSDYGIINIDSVAESLPEGGGSLVTDTRLIDREDVGIRVFRLNGEVPGHYHENSDTYIFVTSGKALYALADGEPVVVGAGDFIYFKRGTNHEVIEILEEPFVAITIDTPPRDPKDVVFQKDSDAELIETK
jgi:multiple sugar transport system substrate-binding protein